MGQLARNENSCDFHNWGRGRVERGDAREAAEQPPKSGAPRPQVGARQPPSQQHRGGKSELRGPEDDRADGCCRPRRPLGAGGGRGPASGFF